MNNYQTHKHNTNLFMLKATIGIVLLSTLIVAFPGLSEAKTIHQSTTLSKSKARTISISATLLDPKPSTAEKPILNTLTVSSNSKIESAIDLYPKMAVVRIEPARPFYIFSRAKSVGLKLSSLTPGAKYYLYKEKLRNPTIFTANEEGSYSLSLDTPRHRYLILKTTESTWHIDSDGGECENTGFPFYNPGIGTWNDSTKTCTLSPTATIDEIIEIDDAGITIDGDGRTIEHADSFGIYANTDILEPTVSNITIKNITIKNQTNGITLIDVENATIEDVTIEDTTKGIDLKDSDLVTIRRGTVRNNDTGFDASNVSGVVLYRNNFIANTSNDLDPTISSGISLSTVATRGNYWNRNTATICDQNTTNPNHCNGAYDAGPATDNLPWACENGWLSSVTCPTVVVPPVGGGTSHIVPLYTQIPSPYPNEADSGDWSRALYAFATSTTDNTTNSCGATIEKCGCALVSGVMVIKYFEPTIDVTPVTLNDYLKNPPTNPKTGKPYDGYTPEGGFHYITGVNVFTDGKIKFNNLEYGKSYANNYAKLDSLLSAGAVVFGRTSKVRGSHYYVIEEKSGDTYKIRDPWYFNTDTLDDEVSSSTNSVYNSRYTKFDYNNDFNLGIYPYSRGDGTLQAYLRVYLASPADFVIEDPLGRKQGYNPQLNRYYYEIVPNLYNHESIGNPELLASAPVHIKKEVYLPEAISGQYKITIYGTGNGAYTLGVDGIFENGMYSDDVQSSIVIGEMKTYNFRFTSGNVTNIDLTTASNTPTNPSMSNNKKTICHIPHGNPNNAHTLSIASAAWGAHQKHGDYEGECDVNRNVEPSVNGKGKSNGRNR